MAPSTPTVSTLPTVAEGLAPELDREADITRRCLARVPDDKLSWRPHPKSWTLGELSTFLAVLPSWIATALDRDSLDLAEAETPARPTSVAGILSLFDNNAAAAREALRGATEAHLAMPWTLRMKGREILTRPRLQIVRDYGLNHLVHHRGQLTVYLRLNDVAVPTIYGPSGDDPSW